MVVPHQRRPSRRHQDSKYLKKIKCLLAYLWVPECLTMVERAPIPCKYCDKMCRRHGRTGSVVTALFHISTSATIDASRRGLPETTGIFFGRGNQLLHSCRWRCVAMSIFGRYYIFQLLFFLSFIISRTSFPS